MILAQQLPADFTGNITDRAVMAQHGALHHHLGHGHEQAGGDTLAADITNHEEQSAIIDHEEVIQVAGHLLRRAVGDRQVEPCITLGEVGRHRQQAALDPACRCHLRPSLNDLDPMHLALHHGSHPGTEDQPVHPDDDPGSAGEAQGHQNLLDG